MIQRIVLYDSNGNPIAKKERELVWEPYHEYLLRQYMFGQLADGPEKDLCREYSEYALPLVRNKQEVISLEEFHYNKQQNNVQTKVKQED